MKVEMRPPIERGYLPTVTVDGVCVGMGTEKSCRRLIAELEADEDKQRAMHDHFLLQDVMEE